MLDQYVTEILFKGFSILVTGLARKTNYNNNNNNKKKGTSSSWFFQCLIFQPVSIVRLQYVLKYLFLKLKVNS